MQGPDGLFRLVVGVVMRRVTKCGPGSVRNGLFGTQRAAAARRSTSEAPPVRGMGGGASDVANGSGADAE
ncbi:hypothetical protein GCM10010228_59750 [Streptomyces massasporeus]|nr:hypothetical protein GCM10010228_59750 [Streptomyces massasporeus]